jgi:hypothetical protein
MKPNCLVEYLARPVTAAGMKFKVSYYGTEGTLEDRGVGLIIFGVFLVCILVWIYVTGLIPDSIAVTARDPGGDPVEVFCFIATWIRPESQVIGTALGAINIIAEEDVCNKYKKQSYCQPRHDRLPILRLFWAQECVTSGRGQSEEPK